MNRLAPAERPTSAAQARQLAALEQIATLASNSAGGDAPPDAVHAARRCVLDWLGVAVAGWHEPAARKLRSALGAHADVGIGAVLGDTIAPDHAALMMGTASHALDYDDTDYVNLIHVSSTILPALIAIARDTRMDGRQFLDIFNAGYEAEDRIGARLGRKLTACGWHVSGVIGRFGSALASGLALGLKPPALADAMAIAATASAGLIGAFGTMSKPLQLARAASDGLVAARLAREGFTGATALLESDPGFCVPYVRETITDWPSLEREWGDPYAVTRNAFKPHASCMITHPVVDAAIALSPQVASANASVQRIACRVNALAPKVAPYMRPATGLEGKFSVAFCCVAGLLIGHATPSAFVPEILARDDVQRLLRRVDIESDATMGEQQAHVSVHLADGRTLGHTVTMAKGNPGNPLSDDELERKFLLLATPTLGNQSLRIAAQLRSFDQIPDVAAWLRGALA